MNTAADSLARMRLKFAVEVRPEIPEDVRTKLIELTTSSSDVVDEEKTFIVQADHDQEPEDQILEGKKRFWGTAAESVEILETS